MDPECEVIHVDSDPDESDDEESAEISTAEGALFGAPQQVFIVRALSKAMTGYRPSVMCEGFLAELSKSSSGYILAPLGRDQQLSFKYEPPSPKFSRKRPSCLSYRLQLLHGSQFLYSLRGLPKALRCQRSAHALEWGPVHLVFAAAADLDTFLATLKYVDVEEMVPMAEGPSRAGSISKEGGSRRQTAGSVSLGTENTTAGASSGPTPSASGAVGEDSSGGGGGGAREGGSLGGGIQWAVAAARLLASEVEAEMEAEAEAGRVASIAGGEAPRPTAGPQHAAEQPDESRPASSRPGSFFHWVQSQTEAILGTPLLAATAGAAVLAAALAAFLLSGRLGSSGRGVGRGGKGT